VVNQVHEYERTKPGQHPIGITGHGAEDLASMLASPADWISPGSRDGYRDLPPAWDGHTKVSLLDTDHVWGVGGHRAWVWNSFLRGHNPLFMDPYDGSVLGKPFDPAFDPVRQALGQVLAWSRRIDLARMAPQGGLASSGVCLADPGREFLVYLASGAEVTVDLGGEAAGFAVTWFDPQTGETRPATPVHGSGVRVFASPFAPTGSVLHIKRQP